MATPSLNQQRKQVIEVLQKWMKNVITNKSWQNYDDLHIDEINEYFKVSNNWDNGSLFVFNCLSEIIDKSSYDAFLTITLSDKKTSNYHSIKSFKDFADEISHITPPSLYLFPIKENNYEMTIKSFEFLESISNEIGLNVFYKEDKEENDYYRTIYVRLGSVPNIT